MDHDTPIVRQETLWEHRGVQRAIQFLLSAVWLLRIVAIGLAVLCCSPPARPDRMRVGWQTPWATQGQVVQVLKHTNLLDRHGIEAEFKGFNYGGPLNEAALAGDVDVIFTADQPAVTLLARGGRWTIVGRLMYNRVAIYVPPESPVRGVRDLLGRRIAMPYGAAAQREALSAIRQSGLDPAVDVRTANLDIYEQMSLVQAGTPVSWGRFDALAGFDPTPAILEQKGLARIIHVGRVVSLVLVADEYLARHPESVVEFLQAFVEAFYFYARNPARADAWFQQESRLGFETSVLKKVAAVEPNMGAKSIGDIRILLDAGDLATLQEAARFLEEQGLAPSAIDVADHVDLSFAATALRRLAASGFEPARVKARD